MISDIYITFTRSRRTFNGAKMGELRRAVSVAICYGRSRLIVREFPTQYKGLLPGQALSCLIFDRGAHTQHITRNIRHISNDELKLTVDPQTMKCAERLNRPICIMLSWLLAKPHHVMKYASLYLERGFDVVSVTCTPWQLMNPSSGAKVVARDLIKFMSQNGQRFVVHGFSVGGYVWSEGLLYATANREHMGALERVEAQVWDSVADITAVTVGVPSAVFPNNRPLQSVLRAAIKLYLRSWGTVMAQYTRASAAYYASPCRAPALFLLSSADPVGAEANIRNACAEWRRLGIKCTFKCWESSPHVLHYMHHPEEYLQLLEKHLSEHANAGERTRRGA
ncbi:unnamed protein product, partial [Iphiclides podalirius]